MTVRTAALQRWYSCHGWYSRGIRDEQLETAHVRDAYVAGWFAGGAHAIKSSAAIAGLVPTVELFIDLLAADLDRSIDERESPMR